MAEHRFVPPTPTVITSSARNGAKILRNRIPGAVRLKYELRLGGSMIRGREFPGEIRFRSSEDRGSSLRKVGIIPTHPIIPERHAPHPGTSASSAKSDPIGSSPELMLETL